MTASSKKELFTIIGEFKEVGDEVRFVPKSTKYFRTASRKAPLGKPVSAVFYDTVATRSKAQLAYHWVLLGYLAEYTGYTKDELHDAILRLKFGTRTLVINGKSVDVRKSVSDAAKLSKADMVELIEYDLEVCRTMGVNVPTPEELGYISN